MKAKGKRVTVISKFHNTDASFILPADNVISKAVYDRVKRELCGRGGDCRCNSLARNLDGADLFFNHHDSGGVDVIID